MYLFTFQNFMNFTKFMKLDISVSKFPINDTKKPYAAYWAENINPSNDVLYMQDKFNTVVNS